MDQQQSAQSQQTPQNNPQTNESVPQQSTNIPLNPPLTQTSQSTTITPKKSYKKLFLSIAVVFLVVSGVAAYWFLIKKDSEPVKNTDQSAQTPAPQSMLDSKTITPVAYAFIYKNNSKVSNSLMLKPLDSAKPESVLVGTERASLADIKDTYIAITTFADDKIKSETVLLSTDEGKTFASIYTGKASTDNTSLGEQITSIKISDDKKTVAFASLVYGDKTTGNTVKLYDIAAKTTKDLFTSKKAGVFISKLDIKNIYYRTGCYNCDGAQEPVLYSQSIASPKEVIVYEDKTADVYVGITPNNDVTRLLIGKSNQNCEGLGGCKPYSLEQYDFATKAITALLTIPTENPPIAGYSSTNELYLSNVNNIMTLKKGATVPSVLFEGTTPIMSVLYMDDSIVVFTTGTYSNSTLYTFDRAGNKTTEVMKLTGNQQVLGVLIK